jgi:hypothetical protein
MDVVAQKIPNLQGIKTQLFGPKPATLSYETTVSKSKHPNWHAQSRLVSERKNCMLSQ